MSDCKGDNRNVINATLIALKRKGLVSEPEYLAYLYSSSENAGNEAWSVSMASGDRFKGLKTVGKNTFVRVSLEF